MTKSIPEFVYHYTTREIALEHILSLKRIRPSSLGRTNDPRETKSWGMAFGGALGDTDLLHDHSIREAAAAYNRIRLDEWWVLCLSQDNPSANAAYPLRDYHRGYARARMWAHYAEKHRGVCLEFDGPSLHQAIVNASGKFSSVFYGGVTYRAELIPDVFIPGGESAFQIHWPNVARFESIEDGVRAHILRHYRRLFLEKDSDWSSELEFRWLVHSAVPPADVDITSSIRSVIVGADFPLVYKPTVRQLCDVLSIGLDRMSWPQRLSHRNPWKAG